MRVAILRALTWGIVGLSVASPVWLAHRQSADPGSVRPQATPSARSVRAFVLPMEANATVIAPSAQAQTIETAYRRSLDWRAAAER